MFKVYQVGFLWGTYDTLPEAMAAAARCFEYSYVINTETGERIDYGGPVSG